MTGTENVNLTDTTGKYEMRVLTEFCCYFIVVCVCVSAGCLMPAKSTVAVLMSSARSHGRHGCLRLLTFTLPHPLPSQAQRERPAMCACVCVFKQNRHTVERIEIFFPMCVCACAGDRNIAYMHVHLLMVPRSSDWKGLFAMACGPQWDHLSTCEMYL